MEEKRTSGIKIGSNELTFFAPNYRTTVELVKLIEHEDQHGLLLWAIFAKLNEMTMLQMAHLKFMQDAQQLGLQRMAEATQAANPGVILEQVMETVKKFQGEMTK